MSKELVAASIKFQNAVDRFAITRHPFNLHLNAEDLEVSKKKIPTEPQKTEQESSSDKNLHYDVRKSARVNVVSDGSNPPVFIDFILDVVKNHKSTLAPNINSLEAQKQEANESLNETKKMKLRFHITPDCTKDMLLGIDNLGRLRSDMKLF